MELIEAVGRLVDAGLVIQRGKLPRATFLFKHALVQDAAHSTLLRGRRQRLHARIAQVIEQGFPALVDEQPETLAHHYAQAGQSEQAITYLAQRNVSTTLIHPGLEFKLVSGHMAPPFVGHAGSGLPAGKIACADPG